MYFFKRVTGQSFLAYLNRFRIAKAQSLLASTDSPISAVSQQIGFCDQSHFGVVFRKLVGMTPLAYRRRFGWNDQPEPIVQSRPVVRTVAQSQGLRRRASAK
jgi:AraC-like DNA-binding protein